MESQRLLTNFHIESIHCHIRRRRHGLRLRITALAVAVALPQPISSCQLHHHPNRWPTGDPPERILPRRPTSLHRHSPACRLPPPLVETGEDGAAEREPSVGSIVQRNVKIFVSDRSKRHHSLEFEVYGYGGSEVCGINGIVEGMDVNWSM